MTTSEESSGHEHEPVKFNIGGEYPGFKTTCRICGCQMILEWDVEHDDRLLNRAAFWAGKAGLAEGRLDALRRERQTKQ